MHLALAADKRADPFLAAAADAVAACVHCGFCNATCPTYKILGDERDGPRGRIYAMKEMLERDAAPEAALVPHLDRCLSCLSCRTTCPSGVDYARLIDLGRAAVAAQRRRSPAGFIRRALAVVMTRPALLRMAVVAGRLASRLPLPLPAMIKAALGVAANANPTRGSVEGNQVYRALGARRARAALLTGCAQRAVAPEINEATVRLLCRLGCEVEVVGDAACCGSLDHHLGHTTTAHRHAAQTIEALRRVHCERPFDYVVSNTTGCGAHLKDVGFQLQGSPHAENAATLAGLVRDVCEIVDALGMGEQPSKNQVVAYHAACTLQHGQRIKTLPRDLLSRAGFVVETPVDPHLCCGSAGTYNILQPALATRLGADKAGKLEALQPDVVATGNVGCILQLRGYLDVPVVHTVELLDWASGGPPPLALGNRDLGDA